MGVQFPLVPLSLITFKYASINDIVMIERKLKSIEITPCYILDKGSNKVLLLTRDKDFNDFKTMDSAPFVNFKKGDYLFMSKMIGKGFVQIDYALMEDAEIVIYFPKKEEKIIS
jgi:hypothetical protein